MIKKRIRYSTLSIIVGYLLSPLSFWNDLFVNIPIAYVLAVPITLIDKNLFFPALIFFYWVSNVAGFVMMHAGYKSLRGKLKFSSYELAKNVGVSAIYTLLIILLIQFNILAVPDIMEGFR